MQSRKQEASTGKVDEELVLAEEVCPDDGLLDMHMKEVSSVREAAQV